MGIVYTYIRLYVSIVFFFNDTATTEIYTLSLHDALPISTRPRRLRSTSARSSTAPTSSSTASRSTSAATTTSSSAPSSAVRSEEHTSELQSRQYLVCRLLLEKKKCNRQRRAAATARHRMF